MSITNREVFANDPTAGDIPNLGVAKVRNPEDDGDWRTLEWELRSFVCEGEYERGLDRILSQFLSHLGQNEQPAVWVSGFYGSGKSHLMRVLEYLWRDTQLSGTSARELVDLPDEIRRHLTELSTVAKREGGLWSAAGTLGAGAAGSIRLAFLSVVFEAAGLPQQYAPARLVLFLKEHGLYDAVRSAVEAKGKEFDHELRNMYVSPVLAEALIAAGAEFGTSAADVSAALRTQYPTVSDLGNDEMLDTFEDVLRLQSNSPDGKLPLTLIVLDEMQQYINEDNSKAEHVQHIVEGCSARFDSRVLVVATGQSDLTANATLQKLIDRFAVNVALSDTDVEAVVRKVVLRKTAAAQSDVTAALDRSSGEISRHLAGTRLGPKGEDKNVIVADYPLLPTRRRFWERALRAIDKAGKSGVLRTQLKIVHEAARSVADKPLGHVVGGDFMFRSESASMLQSGVLLREIDELIRGLQDGTADGELKSRACSLVFLISQLPHDGVGDVGVRATADIIADLMVEDLADDGAMLRREVPRVLEELVEDGKLMKLPGEQYRLQTEEGSEWTKDFNRRRTSIRDDGTRMSSLRKEQLYSAVETELGGIKLVQGASATSRKTQLFWDDDEPTDVGVNIPVWIRDEWTVSESKVKESAARAGTDSATVFVLLPKVDDAAIRDTLAEHAAAQETLTLRPEPQTDEGRQAKQAMQSRLAESHRRLLQLFNSVVDNARVFQGGGNELTTSSLRDAVTSAAEKSLSRKFHKFNVADHADWGKVVSRVGEGAPDALKEVGWTDEAAKHPVCKEVLERVSGGGTQGSEVQRQLADAPYGWPADAVNGALRVLVGSRDIRAERDHAPVNGPKELPPTQIGKTTFFKEVNPLSTSERIALRGLLNNTVDYVSGSEEAAVPALLQHLVEAAASAGGPAPLPAAPDTSHLSDARNAVGNEQARAVVKMADQIRNDLESWGKATAAREKRLEQWSELDRLLDHAGSLELDDIRAERQAVLDDRLLLTEPDPVAPLVDKVCAALRSAYTDGHARMRAAYQSLLDEIAASDGWEQLDDGQRERVIADASLTVPDEPDVSTKEGLIRALAELPLTSMQDRVQVLPARASDALVQIARILEPEPKVARVPMPSRTLRNAGEVDAYLDSVRTTLMEHIDAGETVITS